MAQIQQTLESLRPSTFHRPILHSLRLAAFGLFFAALPGCDSANEPAPDSSPGQEAEESTEQDADVVKLYNVYLVGAEVVPIDPDDDDPEPYSAKALELFNHEREAFEYEPGLRSPVRCESCICSQGTCVCEGCEVETQEVR